jgi:hypothetical protein
MQESSNLDQDPIVTINRRGKVVLLSVVAAAGFCAVVAGTIFLFGGKVANDVNSMMLAMLGLFLAGLLGIGFFWVRARWICVAVIDMDGIIASTLVEKWELSWAELIGVRTTLKLAKNATYPTVRLLLLLEDSKCLEATLNFSQFQDLKEILEQAEFKPNSVGQQLGTLKGVVAFCVCCVAFLLGIWWDAQLLQRFNAGLFPAGNARSVLIQIALAVVAPIGGFSGAIWALYHLVMRPVLYMPGWINRHA